MATITIPAAYVEDARVALIADIAEDGDTFRDLDPNERQGNVQILSRNVRLLDQLLDATDDVIVEVTGDIVSHPVENMLETMIRQLSGRIERECVYGPLPIDEIRPLLEQAQWAAGELVRTRPASVKS